ncbi:hypothetical protein EIMP300_18920 [Escherichia coli]|uniref:Uncharacterized protein n=1 Tax=Escherichia coli TaxID=562 RepID=A0A8S0FJY6_ECOLX|nr:hypothetical protein EIMP300_18920 [Escherichia coli]
MGSWRSCCHVTSQIHARFKKDALYTEKDKLPLKVQVVINSLTDYFVEVGKLFQEMHGRGKEK